MHSLRIQERARGIEETGASGNNYGTLTIPPSSPLTVTGELSQLLSTT